MDFNKKMDELTERAEACVKVMSLMMTDRKRDIGELILTLGVFLPAYFLMIVPFLIVVGILYLLTLVVVNESAKISLSKAIVKAAILCTELVEAFVRSIWKLYYIHKVSDFKREIIERLM